MSENELDKLIPKKNEKKSNANDIPRFSARSVNEGAGSGEVLRELTSTYRSEDRFSYGLNEIIEEGKTNSDDGEE